MGEGGKGTEIDDEGDKGRGMGSKCDVLDIVGCSEFEAGGKELGVVSEVDKASVRPSCIDA